jgi:hypothetical protein
MITHILRLISRTRRNHGLEHATLNLLAEHKPGGRFAGHSDPAGFWILGEVSTEELAEISLEALNRLREGKHELAYHQNCGTNYLVSGAAAGLAGAAGMIGVDREGQSRWERIPLVITLATTALILSRPLGPLVQRKWTTSGNPGKLTIQLITIHQLNGTTAHRVQTAH